MSAVGIQTMQLCHLLIEKLLCFYSLNMFVTVMECASNGGLGYFVVSNYKVLSGFDCLSKVSGTVGRTVVSDTRRLQFKSSHGNL